MILQPMKVCKPDKFVYTLEISIQCYVLLKNSLSLIHFEIIYLISVQFI